MKQKSSGTEFSYWGKILGALCGMLAVVMLLGCVNMTASAAVHIDEYYAPTNAEEGDFWLYYFYQSPSNYYSEEVEVFLKPTRLSVYFSDIYVYSANNGWVTPDSYPVVSYKWFKNDKLIEGEKSDYYDVDSTAPGDYRCEITVGDNENDKVSVSWKVTVAETGTLEVGKKNQVLKSGTYYKVVPKETGSYVLYTCDPDASVRYNSPYFYLLDSNGNSMASSSDSGEGYNRGIKIYLSADETYYLHNVSDLSIISIVKESDYEPYKAPAPKRSSLTAGKADQTINAGTIYEIKPSKSDEFEFIVSPSVSGIDGDDLKIIIERGDNTHSYRSSYSSKFNYFLKAGQTYFLRIIAIDAKLSINYSPEAQAELKDAEAAKQLTAAKAAQEKAEKDLQKAQQDLDAAKANSGANSPEAKAAKEALAKAEADLKAAKKKLAAAEAKAKKLAIPAKPVLKKMTPGKKQFKVTWKKIAGIKGYELQYALNKKFTKEPKTVKLKASKTSYTAKKLKAKKKYYVRLRAYKTVSGGTIYGKWSKVLNKKIK